ncbi:hypothetical protein HN615_11735 [Candidatus Woesearchaeota archaeon]|jgi:hypothetical protein|nr:hypothetical protein [Candidatus Woesearchaeota archaeon]
MTEEEYKKFLDISNIFSEIYCYIDSEQVISKPHYLDKYLSFGFRKDDVTLSSFLAYSNWGSMNAHTYYSIGTFDWWMTEYVAPYISHGKVVENILIRKNVGLISKEIVKFFNLHKEVNSSGNMEARIEEIKGAVVYTVIQMLKVFKSPSSEDIYNGEVGYWIENLNTLREEINNVNSHNELNYMLKLFDELKQ